jgi:hypothetical protein
VIDTKSQALKTVAKFPTKEVERNGQKRIVGPSSATVGDGVVYVGNRADSSVRAFDAQTRRRPNCGSRVPRRGHAGARPGGLVTAARLDRDPHVQPASPKVARRFKLDGFPEGTPSTKVMACSSRTSRTKTAPSDRRRDAEVTATWLPSCGEEGPGLAIEPGGA